MDYFGSNKDFLINAFDNFQPSYPHEHKEFYGWERVNFLKEKRKPPFVQKFEKTVCEILAERDYLEGLDTPEFNDDMEDLG